MKSVGASIRKRALVTVAWVAASWISPAVASGDVAMVTFLHGGLSRADARGAVPVQSFVKLKQGDRLTLAPNSQLQIVYFENGRHETWRGGGRLEIAETEGRAYDLPKPEVKVLPEVMVKQIAKTPVQDSQGRVGMVRMRAVSTPAAVAQVENTYRRLRLETDRDDLNPELYLLSGLFEMRELDRVEQILGELQKSRPGNPQASLMVSLYRKAVKNAREAREL